MSDSKVLCPTAHNNLRITTRYGSDFGDNVQFVPTYPLEFRNIQSCYPIFFTKSAESGEFYPIALFGFEPGENLYLDGLGWDASYIPLMIKRQPFMIGYQNDDKENKNPVVMIDIKSPKISKKDGEALFDENDQPSEFLQKIMGQLEALDKAHQHNKGFIEALIKYDLIEPFTLEVKLNNGSTNQLKGFYTINEDKLAVLKGDALADLNKNSFLQAIYMSIASYSRIKPLIEKKNILSGN